MITAILSTMLLLSPGPFAPLDVHDHGPTTEDPEPADPPETEPTDPCAHWVQVDGGYICVG